MARTGLRALAPALVCLFGAPALAGDGPDKRLNHHLAVQVAFEQGLGHLKRQDHAAAVRALEKQIAYIDGNARYLQALRDAYRGLVRDLQRAGKGQEAELYRTRLAILEPTTEVNTPAALSPPLKSVPPARPALSAPVAPTGVVSRGKAQEEAGDPFAESNRAATLDEGRGALGRAEKAFTEGRYDQACSLYEQAGAGVTGASRERWAYCKLYRVAEALNKSARADLAEMEGEVKQALSLASSERLETFGQGLLKRLREAAPAVTVKHSPRKGGGWAVAESGHFRLFHVTTSEAAEKLVRIAEAARLVMERRWFGEEGSEWSPRCEVYVYPTAEAYAKATGRPTQEPGHSTFEFTRGTGRVLSRRVHVRLDDPDLYTGTLRHEATHVVLAGRFGEHDIPRWADEGIAVLSEPAARVRQHTGQLAGLRRDGLLFRVGDLLAQADAPPGRQLAAFYAQSVSVVDHLVRKKDAVTFTRFVKLAVEKGYDAALERYYGYKTVAELERDWQAATFGGDAVAAVANKKN